MSADELPDRRTAAAADPDEEQVPVVDLRTLLGEMAALKAEVRAVTVEARAARQGADETSGVLRAELDRAAGREAALRRTADEERRRAAQALIDVADRLGAALRVPVPRRWFRPAPETGLRGGLELTLRGVGERLASLGVTRVPCEGAPFDPETMEALRAVQRDDLPEGTVVEEITAGWRDERGPVRLAQVVVSRREKTP